MVGILLITHGSVGVSLLHSAAQILGAPLAQVEEIGLLGNEDPAQVQALAGAAVRRLDSGTGVLVLADMCGATPCNVATKLDGAVTLEVVSGLNLPMLMRALTYRDRSLAEVAQKAITGGHDGILHLRGQS